MKLTPLKMAQTVWLNLLYVVKKTLLSKASVKIFTNYDPSIIVITDIEPSVNSTAKLPWNVKGFA